MTAPDAIVLVATLSATVGWRRGLPRTAFAIAAALVEGTWALAYLGASELRRRFAEG